MQRLQQRLCDRLATHVEIRQAPRGRGTLVIHFDGTDAFGGLLERLNLRDLIDG